MIDDLQAGVKSLWVSDAESVTANIQRKRSTGTTFTLPPTMRMWRENFPNVINVTHWLEERNRLSEERMEEIL
ncbi:hypothetical protein AVEN_53592-1 [Araneus ventricosus]|uniref:Uncharacterized protein n=1 Tax=Araneus ventricosus TaxID=182803 RepID=A0A4Y2PUC9_ARAVE|nr:hypothetical protein AVEN_53592-1 [Araneus ventricosus]